MSNELITRGPEIMYVPATKLITEDGFNLPGREEEDQDLLDLAESLYKNGPKVAIKGYKKGDNYVVVVGHRRYAAAQIVKRKYKKTVIFPLMTYPKGTPLRDFLLEHFTTNDGKPLSPLQRAYGVAKLIQDGMKPKQIAEALNFSEVYIGNLIKLTEAPMEAQELVKKNVISATFLIQELKKKTNIDEWIQKVASSQLSAGPGAVQIEIAGVTDQQPAAGKKQPKKQATKKAAKVTKKKMEVNSLKEFKTFVKKGGAEIVGKTSAPTFHFLNDLLANKYDYDDILKYFEK